MSTDLVSKIKPECEKALEFFESELKEIRTGRPSISLVENIKVKCFGGEFPLKQLAAISLADARQILIEPWDKSYLEPLQKAIESSGRGFSVIAEGQSIRLSSPAMTEDYRKEILRTLGEKKEKARQTIRHFREKAWDRVQSGCQKGEVSEDEKFRAKDGLQDLVDEYNEKIEELAERKQKEIEG